jgi:hypothetical protein
MDRMVSGIVETMLQKNIVSGTSNFFFIGLLTPYHGTGARLPSDRLPTGRRSHEKELKWLKQGPSEGWRVKPA